MTAILANIRLAELQYITQQFINEDPTTITLLPSRGTATKTASGAHTYSNATPRAPQTFRLAARGIDSARAGIEQSSTDRGKTVQFTYDLIGLYDAVVEIGDTWEGTALDGTPLHYHVDSVAPYNGYEVISVVTAFATEPQAGDA